MFRTTRFACVASLVAFATSSSILARADVLSAIQAEFATLGVTEYQIAFVTSDGTTADSTNIQDYNNFVTAEALLGVSLLERFRTSGDNVECNGINGLHGRNHKRSIIRDSTSF